MCMALTAQVSGGEARRLLPPGSFLKFYDQSFTGEEFKRVSSEGVFHQVGPPYQLYFKLMYMSLLNRLGHSLLVWVATSTLAENDVTAWR